jgi:LPS O-antigen subunit length determinant protein (WzzB/FepE family)
MIILSFLIGGMFGALMMALCSVEAYKKGWQDGAKHNE